MPNKGFDVSEFSARIGNGLATPARFRVLMTGALFESEESRLLAILCNQAQLPARQFATVDYTTHGPIMKMPYQNMYDDVVMSFYCKEDMGVKYLFQEWQNSICDNNGSGQFAYLNDYVADVIIEQFDAKGEAIYACRLVDAYPMMVSPLQLDWASQNAFHNLQVTFAYRYWIEEEVTPSGVPLGSLSPHSAGSQMRSPTRSSSGSSMEVNNLYPGVDTIPALNKTGVATYSRQDGQFSTNIQQSIRGFASGFGRAALGPVAALPIAISDRFLLFD